MKAHGSFGRRLLFSMPAFAGAIAVAAAFAGAAVASVPANTARPTISGTDKDGSTLTASTGSWSNSPTSFSYRWRRCADDGTSCSDISGATGKSYRLVSADVLHVIRVVVTASNSSGSASATSNGTPVIGSRNGPTNTSKPVITGNAVAGAQLTVTAGSWSPALTSMQRQWERCDANGGGCLNIDGATGSTYDVRSSDVGHRLRVLVIGTNSGGRTPVITNATSVVSGTLTTTATTTTTTTVTTTVQGNRAPTVRFISLRRIGARVYARFRICDDSPGRITVIERDNKARVLSARRRFRFTLVLQCATYARSWVPAVRFRGRGRLVVSLRAVDRSGALSLIRSRSLRHS